MPLDDAVTALESHVETLEGGPDRAGITSSWSATETAIAEAFDQLDTERLAAESDDPNAVTDVIIAVGLAVDRFEAIDQAVADGLADDTVAVPFAEARAQTIDARQRLDRLMRR